MGGCSHASTASTALLYFHQVHTGRLSVTYTLQAVDDLFGGQDPGQYGGGASQSELAHTPPTAGRNMYECLDVAVSPNVQSGAASEQVGTGRLVRFTHGCQHRRFATRYAGNITRSTKFDLPGSVVLRFQAPGS